MELGTVSSSPSGPSNLQPTIITKPSAKDLTYNRKPQELVNPGVAEHGFFVYSLEYDRGFKVDVPTATEPGTYKVYYMVWGSEEGYSALSGEDLVVSVTINPAPATVSAPTTSTPAVVEPPITIAKAPSIKKPKAAKKGKVTVTWKKFKKTKKTKSIWSQIKGIEVQYSTDPTFATNTVSKLLGKKKTKLVIKGIQKNTTYYVRVRYTDGAGGVSNWSATKKVKTKKK